MSNIFSTVPKAKIPRSVFNLSHEVKLTCEIGKLVPFICREVVPGDRWHVNSQFLCRFAPMLAPIMHNVNLYTHFFFVPNRLIYSDWEDYITGGQDGTSTPVAPFMEVKKYQRDYKGLMSSSLLNNSLCDYLGLPCTTNHSPAFDSNSPIALGTKISALPFAAYQMIFDQYYRDETLDPEHDFCLPSGEVHEEVQEQLLKLRNRSWRKDYFTSALPWPQRGQDIVIPFADEAPIVQKGPDNKVYIKFDTDVNRPFRLLNSSGENLRVARPLVVGTNRLNETDDTVQSGTVVGVRNDTVSATSPQDVTRAVRFDPNGSLCVDAADWANVKADLRSATGITINDFRRLVRVQMWLERNARGGARYTEQLRAHSLFYHRMPDYSAQSILAVDASPDCE